MLDDVKHLLMGAGVGLGVCALLWAWFYYWTVMAV